MTETRFVVITNSPITVACMNWLFGVTMAEQGVSQLVSVDLQEAERLREARCEGFALPVIFRLGRLSTCC